MPFLKLVGGIALLWVAMKLIVPRDEHGEGKMSKRRTACGVRCASSRSPTS